MDEHVIHIDVDSLVVNVDALKVERIVDNLLANAGKHTLQGTEIWVSARLVAEGVLIVVEDAGEGISKDGQEHIFEPFQQLDPHSEHAPGVGIGLALVAKFAELHGGRAWVQDRAGGGASFRVFLSTE